MPHEPSEEQWCDNGDATARCPGPFGAVTSEESVARHIHSGNSTPIKAAFQKSDIFRPAGEIQNACGEAGGASLDRILQITPEQLAERSREQAGDKHTPLGSVIASVDALRSIRLPGNEGQLVYVYDDARDDNPQHSVIRAKVKNRSDQARLRDMIVKFFS